MCARCLAINKPKDNFIKLFQQQGYNKKTTREDKDAENKLNENENGRIYGQLEFGQQKSS